MLPNLGLVCITVSNEVRYRTITRKDAYQSIPWIEVEAKHKEIAIHRLQAEWLAAIKESRSDSTLEKMHGAGRG